MPTSSPPLSLAASARRRPHPPSPSSRSSPLCGLIIPSPAPSAATSSGAKPPATTSRHPLMEMDVGMKQLQQTLVESEIDAEHLLLARHQLIENDKVRNGNREALTALRKRARTTKTSVPSPFDKIMEELAGTGSSPLVKDICPTCGDYDPKEHTWMMLPGSDIFARMPFHAVHATLEKDQERLDYETKTLQSYVKEKSLAISETGAIADKINPGILNSLVTLKDERK